MRGYRDWNWGCGVEGDDRRRRAVGSREERITRDERNREERIIGGRDERAESKTASERERWEERDRQRGAREQWCRVRLIWILIHCVPEGEVGDNLPPENGISIWGRGQIELRCSYNMPLAVLPRAQRKYKVTHATYTLVHRRRHMSHKGRLSHMYSRAHICICTGGNAHRRTHAHADIWRLRPNVTVQQTRIQSYSQEKA